MSKRSMKAMVVREWGGPEQLLPAELPVPEPTPGHVRVRVVATSVNPVDYKIRSNGPPFGPELPAVLGSDVAGIVDAVGPDVTRLKPGDEVYGCAGGFRGMDGALAEYMRAPESLLVRKPEAISFREAAALPLVSITAWEALHDFAGVTGTNSVLVHAGAGGVGHVAVQLAAAVGANVAATVSTEEKAHLTKSLADVHTIRYREESPTDYVGRLTAGVGFDVVFDTVGGDNLQRSFEAARVGGTVVGIALRTSADLAIVHRKELRLQAVFMVLRILSADGHSRHRRILDSVSRLVTAGRLRPLVDSRRFSLAEAADAHRLLESGGAVGKVVIDVASES